MIDFSKARRFVKDGVEYPLANLYTDHPDTSFPVDLTDAVLAEFGILPVTLVPAPVDPTKDVVEGVPALIKGVWTQTWTVTDASADEIAARQAALVPQAVTNLQFRKALVAAGKMAAFRTYFGTLSLDAQDEWQLSPNIRRDSTMIAALATAANLTAKQLDNFFIAASGVKV